MLLNINNNCRILAIHVPIYSVTESIVLLHATSTIMSHMTHIVQLNILTYIYNVRMNQGSNIPCHIVFYDGSGWSHDL